MKLIVQPGDGIEPIIKGIKKAKESVEIVIFRLDLPEVERALMDAAGRGVFVHALIAFTNRGGEKRLRKLETDFLAAGITVARTAGDLLRYHGKMMVVDHKELYLLAFNFTHLDINRSRSFGLITRNRKLVQEASKLFECDTTRKAYATSHSRFVVSPVNARKELTRFLGGAKKELLIWDLKISDRAMLHLLQKRAKSGVKLRIIGEVSGGLLPARRLGPLRLHTRTIIRDRRQAFIGSQSLRRSELDARREIGVVFRELSTVSILYKIFQEDWAATERPKAAAVPDLAVSNTAKKLAKMVANKLPVEPVAKEVAKAVRRNNGAKISDKEVKKTVKETVKTTVKQVLKKATIEAVQNTVERGLVEDARERQAS